MFFVLVEFIAAVRVRVRVIVAAVIESVVAGSVVHVSALSTNPNATNGSDGIELVLLKLPLLVLSCCRKRGGIKKKEGIPGGSFEGIYSGTIE